MTDETPKPSPWRRRLKLAAALTVLLLVILAGVAWALIAPIATGYSARIACAAVYLQGRDLEQVAADDLGHLPFVSLRADPETRSIVASFGPYERRAVYREGLGGVLVIDAPEALLMDQSLPARPREDRSDIPWPDGDKLSPPPAEVDLAVLEAALAWAFEEPDPERLRKTRAVVVLYDGQLVGERYAAPFGPETPLLGWSMTKSAIALLYGRLHLTHGFDPSLPAQVPEWSSEGDSRGGITTDMLLRMSSGLEFSEEYFNPTADAVNMLFVSRSTAGYAADKPLAHPVNTRWSYSSGTSNILARQLAQVVGGEAAAWRYAREELFDKLGMQSALIETDAAGTMVGSSLMYATARDWARLGLLVMQEGRWRGEWLLAPGWTKYCLTPTETVGLGLYGAHFWLNAGDDPQGANRRWPQLPPDAWMMSGFQGQCVLGIPSRKTLIVRLGLTNSQGAWLHQDFGARVLEAMPEAKGS